MFHSVKRLFSTSVVGLYASAVPNVRAGNAARQKVHPILASKVFIKSDAGTRKARTLRRKEKRLKKQIIRDVNNLKKYEQKNLNFAVDPVLGHANGFMTRIKKEVQNADTRLAGGYDREEFEKLVYGAEKSALDKSKGTTVLHEAVKLAEERKKRALLTILHLRNTSESDKRKLAIKLAREEFRREEGDTGSPEVQSAIMTVKIHFAMEHVKNNPKDHQYTQKVRHCVQQRQRILKYLKRVKPQSYYLTIAKLGLTDDVVTREFNMGRQYFEDYKVWGDKKLIKLSDKQQAKVDKFSSLRKRVQGYHELAKKNSEIIKNLQQEKKQLKAKKVAKQPST
ncbi:hypothetical protein DFJ63DRAFT_318293 [Scheffersomyces coipomensis]|uniref:uncharacterized protein n=1 Tax=Scheffersomyces coipomensis TaxID=1788519 RepID=UPI00315CB400